MENLWIVAAIALLALLAIAWQYRARAVRRWLAFLETYAEREIARESRWKTLARERT